METDNKHLSSSELMGLWASYLLDSMSICIYVYFLKNVKDDDIRTVIEFALDLSEHNIQELTTVFSEIDMAIPKGFTEQDVNIEAPSLFS